MTNPIIGYHSLLDDGTVTASSDPAATPKESAYNWKLFDYWQPPADTSHYLDIDMGAAVDVDYLAFYSSDLYAEAGAAVELYGGSSSPATTLLLSSTITTRGPKLFPITSANHRYFRIQFETTGPFSPKIQAVTVGEQLELEQGLRPGYIPPALGSRNQPYTNQSAGGLFIGRSTEIGPVDFSLSTTILTPAWVRANWPGLLAHIEKYPFFCLPEPDDYTDEAVIAWTIGKIGAPKYSHSNRLSLDLKLKAFV